MKISNRKRNYFNGTYYGYHDEIDVKKTPLYFRLLFVFVILVVPVGIGVSFYEISRGYIVRFIIAILFTMIIEFPLVHLLLVLFDKIKYGVVRQQAKVIGGIFSAISVFLFIGVLLARFMHFATVLGLGIVSIFYAIGIGLCAAGSSKAKREKNVCTMPVWATCTGYETINPHISILDAPDATREQNEVIARAQVSRPIWEFEYDGKLVHATPEQYEGKLKITEGKQYKIFVNPQNPQEVYCEENSDVEFLLNMGKIWLTLSTFLLLLFGVILWILF